MSNGKQLLLRLDQWFAALSKRERIMVLGAVFLVPVYLFAQLVYLPSQKQYSNLLTSVHSQQQENESISDQLVQLGNSMSADPNAAQAEQIDQISHQMASFDTFLRDSVAGLVPPQRMAELLREMLSNNAGLTLVSLKNLPAQSLMPAPEVEKVNTGTTTETQGQDGGVNLYRHGIELKFNGSYLAILKYLGKLQELSQRIFWDGVTVQMSDSYPRAQVTLNVYTLSPEKGWIGG
jgi:MSHA biogenesis protein MshJ